ncbi:hypothetical protein [Paractinoplanes durhamensis]
MLVAVADAAILIATGGLVALVLIVATLAIVAGVVFAARQLATQQKLTRSKVANTLASRDRRRA